MAKLSVPRRKFLQTIGSAAVVSALPSIVRSSQSGPTLKSIRVAVLWEQNFPTVNGCDIRRDILEPALSSFNTTFLSVAQLVDQLKSDQFELLLTPYGSAFPKSAWATILKFLREGGNWLNLGGVPLANPVVRTRDTWFPGYDQTAYHKRLGITQAFKINSTKTYKPTELFPSQNSVQDFAADEIYALYTRLSSTSREPDEAGSDGPHEGHIRPLVFAIDSESRPIAAPIIQHDRMLADFAGGRWVFAAFKGAMNGALIRSLAERAAFGATRLNVKSAFACYRDGEKPSIEIELFRPRKDLSHARISQTQIVVSDATNNVVAQQSVGLRTENDNGKFIFVVTKELAPGFYKLSARITATINGLTEELTHTSGFWIHDAKLQNGGPTLTVDEHFFKRNGQTFPITGTTYMASDVSRQFLFEPNPAVWDKDFAEMKAAGVNMIRTGIWTGWKRYMSQNGVEQSILRAFDAFLLTARKYDIPVIFTFFAFLPETWGGVNAYLDPKSIEAQKKFISAFTSRCAGMNDVLWDFINEPSFCSPKYLWNCRPNYDEFEQKAWREWLTEKYPAPTEEERKAKIQQQWRTTSDDLLELPKLQDFENVNLIDDRQPLKTADYRLFAQDMFIRWVREMTKAVRSNGNPRQLITVGQDEAGLGDSPNMHFFAADVDFTSLHNWWSNDDLVWDSVLAKSHNKASLVEETGIMFYEKSDAGAGWRTEQEASNLLERKMAICLAADGAGFIEWIWNTNPFMNSTNEVGIGFYRVDGSAKPELQPFLKIAKFMSQYGPSFSQRELQPVAMVIPHTYMFAPRNSAVEATRRCVRAMYYNNGIPLQAISEYKVSEYSGKAKFIIVPSPRVLTEECWNWLLAEAAKGATLAVTGIINADESWRTWPRSAHLGWNLETAPVSPSESITIDRPYTVRYEGEELQRLEKAVVVGPDAGKTLFVRPYGKGKIVWSPLPLELGDSMDAVVAFYRLGLRQSGVAPIFTTTPRSPSVLVLPSVCRDVVFYAFVSELAVDTTLQVTHLETRSRFTVNIPAGRTAMALVDRKTGKVLR
jgi:hypothetical protein